MQKARVIHPLKCFSSYTDYAEAAGFPNAVRDSYGEWDYLKEGTMVSILHKGKNPHTGETLYIVEADDGEQWIFNAAGLEILPEPEPKKPVLPKEIADALEAYKQQSKGHALDYLAWKLAREADPADSPETRLLKCYRRTSEKDMSPFLTLVNALQFGYDVEQPEPEPDPEPDPIQTRLEELADQICEVLTTTGPRLMEYIDLKIKEALKNEQN